MKTLNIEIIFAAKEMSKRNEHVFLGGNIDGKAASIHHGGEFVDKESGCVVANVAIELADMTMHQMKISYDVNGQDNYIGRWGGYIISTDGVTAERVNPINLGGLFEENIFEDKYQDLISAWVNEYLDSGVEVTWDEQVVDVIKSIEVNYGLMFIIPNAIATADHFIIQKEEHIAEAAEIARLNNCEYDQATTNMVEVWMSSPRATWYYDNLEDHGPRVKDKDGNAYYVDFPRYLPETVMEAFREGRLTSIKFPSRVRKATRDEDYDDTYNAAKLSTVIEFNFVPAQTITRYCRYGTIEHTLKVAQGKA